MRGWYCKGISVEIEMYFDSIMDSIKTHQSDHCRMERRGGEAERVEEEGGDAVWRGCSSSGPRTPCTPVLSLPLRPHPDTGHRHKDTQSYESGSIPALYWSSILHRLAIQYSAINTTSLSLPSTSTTAKSTSNKLEGRRKILKLSWRLILILIVAFSFGEVVKYCKRLAANCISSHLNCSVPFIFLAPNTACHCRHKHLLRAASC